MTEHRDAPRQKSLLRGYVYFGTSPNAVECIVRDISESGARLKFQYPPAAVEVLDLHIPVKVQKLHANVKWQQNDEIGVTFAFASALAAPPSSTLAASQASEAELAKRVYRLETEIVALQQLVKRLQQKIGSKTDAA
jgi:hypothetical protein